MKTAEQLQQELEAAQAELAGTKEQIVSLQGDLTKAQDQNKFYDDKFKTWGTEIGELRKLHEKQTADIADLTQKLSQTTGPTTEPPATGTKPGQGPSPTELGTENEAIVASLSDEEQSVLDEVFESASPEKQKLIEEDEGVRNEFLRQIKPPQRRGWRGDPKSTKPDDPPDNSDWVRKLFTDKKIAGFTPPGSEGGEHSTRSKTRTDASVQGQSHVNPNDFLGQLKRDRANRSA